MRDVSHARSQKTEVLFGIDLSIPDMRTVVGQDAVDDSRSPVEAGEMAGPEEGIRRSPVAACQSQLPVSAPDRCKSDDAESRQLTTKLV